MFDENMALFIMNLLVFVLCGGLFMIMPQLTRKSYLFGVKIPPEQSGCPEALALKKRYVFTCLLGVFIVLAICVVQFIAWRDMTLLASMYLPLLIIPVNLAAFIPNWKKAVRLKEEKGWKVLNAVFAETSSSHSRGNLSLLPWIWYIASFVIVAVSVMIAVMRFPALPEKIAGHLDANLRPTSLVEKTWWNVLMMPVINVLLLAVMIPTAISIEKAKLQIDPVRPRLSFAQHRLYRRRMGHAMGFLTFGMILMIAVMGLPILFPDSPVWGRHIFWGCMIIFTIPMALLIVTQIKTGQGGCKIKLAIDEDSEDDLESPSMKSRIRGHGDDRYWIFGMFYYNPDDPAYVVENRFGTKIGFNYARILVKIGVALLFVGLVAMYVWMTMLLL